MMHSRLMKSLVLFSLVTLVWGAATASSEADDSASRNRPQASPRQSPFLQTLLRRILGDRRFPEILEMIVAFAEGSKMGPGEGWFHPGQSRYGWNWMAARFDVDKNGRITREEFQGPGELFERLDRDGDGVLTAADFDWSDLSPFLRQVRATSQWFGCIDTNSNGRISREEWHAFFARAAKGKDHLTREDLRAALNPPTESGPGDPSILALALGLLSGELGSMREGPDLGQQGPDFVLRTQDGKQLIRLSDFRGKKPVV
jgi:hypothetical protein